MRNMRLSVAALVCGLLAGCSADQLALPDRIVAEQPAATAVLPSAAPSVAAPTAVAQPAATSAPLPALAPVPTLAAAQIGALEAQQQALVELYRRVNPAVVSIEVAGHHPAAEGAPAPDQEIPFAQGSGFLFDDQGHIVTNNHVVEGATGFQVRFANGLTLAATLVGADSGSDLAVLKVGELPPATAPLALADSRAVEVGQMAIAIGNPFGACLHN